MPSQRFKLVVAVMAVLTVATYVVEPFVGARSFEELRPAAPFALMTIDGSAFSLADHNRSVVLLDFMATWCPPCRETTRELQAVRASNLPGAVKIVSIDVDFTETSTQLAQFRASVAGYNGSAESEGWYFALDTPGEYVGPKYGANALPTLILVDTQGNIRHSWVGITPAPEIQRAIDAAVRPA